MNCCHGGRPTLMDRSRAGKQDGAPLFDGRREFVRRRIPPAAARPSSLNVRVLDAPRRRITPNAVNPSQRTAGDAVRRTASPRQLL
jgi:hypothetical protein